MINTCISWEKVIKWIYDTFSLKKGRRYIYEESKENSCNNAEHACDNVSNARHGIVWAFGWSNYPPQTVPRKKQRKMRFVKFTISTL